MHTYIVFVNIKKYTYLVSHILKILSLNYINSYFIIITNFNSRHLLFPSIKKENILRELTYKANIHYKDTETYRIGVSLCIPIFLSFYFLHMMFKTYIIIWSLVK